MTLTTLGDWIGHCTTLFALTFIHEDVAVFAAVFEHMEWNLPVELALTSIFCGMFASDLSIYALGRLAWHNALLRTHVAGPRVTNTKAWLNKHIFLAVSPCRVTLGLLIPTYIACGWFKLPLTRFLLASLLSAILYLPLIFSLALFLGCTVLRPIGYRAWAIVIMMLMSTSVRTTLRSLRERKLRTGNHQYQPLLLHNTQVELTPQLLGMPPLDSNAPAVSMAEHIPAVIFYLPILLRCLWLSLLHRSLSSPTVTNPMIETGGFWGESKSQCLQKVAIEQQCWIATFIVIKREQWFDNSADVLHRLETVGIAFPMVAKPDIGLQGYGVRLIQDINQRSDYIASFPTSEKLLLQQDIPYEGEAGVFYARFPDQTVSKAFSLTFRYLPYLIGNGHDSLHELIFQNRGTRWKAHHHLGFHPEHLGLSCDELSYVPSAGQLVRLSFIGSIRMGGIYRDVCNQITPALSNHFYQIAESMPGSYFGQFDVRFPSFEKLKSGLGFSIIEMNGVGSESFHAWDPRHSLRETYRQLFNTQTLMFTIAASNREGGYAPIDPYNFLSHAARQHRLLYRYPRSG